ncbi:MAG: NUDIX domain-containing protein [Patescibacteria group bacterium]|jgi:8-oxo-dGTP diphosphatase
MTKDKIVFGEKVAGQKYRTRIGIYALIFDDENNLAVIQTKTGYFLPGGGLDGNESHNECLHREAKEEMGWEIEVGKYIGNSAAYHYSTTKNDYCNNDGYFYLAKMIREVSLPTEPDHKVVWLTPADAIKKLYHKNQTWAVEKVVKNLTLYK